MTGGERDAHFLHAQKPLESVLVAPVEEPRALSWMGNKEVLLLGSADGRIHVVEPAFGTRLGFQSAPEPVHIATRDDDVFVLARGGQLQRWNWPSRERLWSVGTPLVGNQGIRLSGEEVAVIGDDAQARREVLVFHLDGKESARFPAPTRAALGVQREGHFVLARSTAEGLTVAALGELWRDLSPPTGHGLRFTRGGMVLGVASGGVTVWNGDGSTPRSIRLPDAANAALHADGRTLALGTREGMVAIADVEAPADSRARPPRVDAHHGPVRGMSFSAKGRWLASVADRCRVWSY
jgi:WD40 repeat protein